jgi:hypothetical protein
VEKKPYPIFKVDGRKTPVQYSKEVDRKPRKVFKVGGQENGTVFKVVGQETWNSTNVGGQEILEQYIFKVGGQECGHFFYRFSDFINNIFERSILYCRRQECHF